MPSSSFLDCLMVLTNKASHRLDRLTSGVLILGKNSQTAGSLARQLREKKVEKQYLALVAGKFPE